MRKSPRNLIRYALLPFVLSFLLHPVTGMAGGAPGIQGVMMAKVTQENAVAEEEPATLDRHNPKIKKVMDVQDRHTRKLLDIPEVVGTATGLSDDGRPAVLVLTRKAVSAGTIPENLEDVPVVTRQTGELTAMRRSVNINTTVFAQPVPIGVSTGNTGECSAGTIGARVKDGLGNLYALSNNHVYALENLAPIGSKALQPGKYDTQCVLRGNNTIGTLSNYVPINFGGANNTVDAAIVLTSAVQLGKATPSGGYGIPNSRTVAAAVGLPVQKYGRTTSLTKGTITGINATVLVGYDKGTATFVNQIIVSSVRGFILAGDSGSLLVTNNTNANPVGLLFAGNSSGTFTVANQIDEVLRSFAGTSVVGVPVTGLAIDGK